MASTPLSSPKLPPQRSELDLEDKERCLSNRSSDGLGLESNRAPEPPDALPAEQDFEWVSGVKLLNIMTAVTLVCFLVLLDSAIIVTAVPRITSDFHSLPDVGWYGSAYQLASATLQPLTGKVFVNFKTKWTFIAFFGIFELGSLICAVATSSKILIVGRAVAGIGTSGLLNGALIIVAQCAPMEKRPNLIGMIMGGFYINLPVGGLVAIMLAFVRIPEQIPKPPPTLVIRSLTSKLDLIGFAIFAPASIQLLLALQYGGVKFAWNSPQIIGLFCGAGSTFIIFLAWNHYKAEEAMIPVSMVRKRTVWTSCLVYGLLMGQLFVAQYYLPIYFQGVRGASPTMSGVYLLPSILSHILAAVSSGALLQRVGYYIPLSLISSAVVAVGSGLISTFAPDTRTGKWIGYQILLGAGRGLGLQMPIIAVQNTLPPAQLPLAMALIMFSQSFTAALFLSFSSTIFTNSLKTLIPKYAPSVDPQTIINAGASGFRNDISGTALSGVLIAYAKSIDPVFYLTAGMAVGCFVFSWGMGWKDMRDKSQALKA